MNRTIAAAVVAGSLAAGGLAGAALGAPGIAGAGAGAAEVTAAAAIDGAGWVQDALAGLVTDGTITQEQSDAVAAALEEARPEHGPGHGGRHHIPLDAVSEALGVTEDDLRTSLRDGQTVAEVAEAEGVELQVVVDAALDALRTRLAERVEAGDITQERADERIAQATERLPQVFAGELRFDGPGRRGR